MSDEAMGGEVESRLMRQWAEGAKDPGWITVLLHYIEIVSSETKCNMALPHWPVTWELCISVCYT